MDIILGAILVLTFALVTAKRITALVNGFALHSFALFLLAAGEAVYAGSTGSAGFAGLYAVAGLVLLLKVLLIPYFLKWISRKIGTEENIGLFINPVLSLFAAAGLGCLSYAFATRTVGLRGPEEIFSLSVSLTVVLTGIFIMIFRMKALAQVVGLLVIENGLFLAVTALCGGMPFFVEIAVFFDVFVCAVILGVFIFRINELFTHVDTSKLTRLKG